MQPASDSTVSQVLGNPQNVKLRFNAEFMKMRAGHKL
jgi:hypothetical protein